MISCTLGGRGRTVRESVIEGRLDLGPVRTDPTGIGEQLLDFLTQGRTGSMSAPARALVLDHLASIRLPGPGWQVPHPLQVAVVVR